MENKFTQKAQNALILAVNLAQDFGQIYVGSEHLLLGLLEERESIASRMLFKRGIHFAKIKSDIVSQIEILEKTSLSSKNMSPRLKRILENSVKLSEKNNQLWVGSEHILYSLLSENDCYAVRVLEENKLNIYEMQNDILTFIQSSQKPPKAYENKNAKDEKGFKFNNFAKNLIIEAQKGKIDPLFCREKECERLIQILSRRTKNNPCLIGEPGVGKTAVVEGLAQRIFDGNVPPPLKNKIIYALDIPSLIAGAKYRGEFEERMKGIMSECMQNKDIILFIDEIHTIIGAGSAEGAIDAANILKPALSRGEIQIIGATTTGEYRKYFEKDSALERRFQPIIINEPTISEAKKMLLGLKKKYETHHSIKISDEAIFAAVDLSSRYINDRFLPDKAIDLIDEAAARVKLMEFSTTKNTSSLQNELAALYLQKEEALLSNDFYLAKSIHNKQKQICENNSELDDFLNYIATPTVSPEDVAQVVSDWTSIPVSSCTSADEERLLGLETKLKARIIGQDQAIALVSQAIRRSRIGMKNHEQPIGSFLFVGPSGVGKTELCVVLSEIMFGTKKSLIKLDMSEYTEKHSISKLIGSPPGYVGYGEGGILTDKVRSNPYSIVLFDEIEKAHPEIYNLMLQILEDGILSDSQGRKISFKNTLIVMTSNLGSQGTKKSNSLGFANNFDEKARAHEREKAIKHALETTFRNEFLNRIDEIVIFNPLSRESIEKICKIMLNSLSERLNKIGIDVEFDASLIEEISNQAYDESSGARKLRHTIRRLVENPLSSKIIEREIKYGDCISLQMKNGELSIINL